MGTEPGRTSRTPVETEPLRSSTALSGRKPTGSPFWDSFERFNINAAGFVIVGLFVVTWVVALVYWRLARVEDKWTPDWRRIGPTR
jgi:hypothetical protein